MTAVLKRSATPRISKVKALDGERRCLASGDFFSKTKMIRFVIAPDHSVVPDLSEKLPGHGLWVRALSESIQLACKKNLFAKAAKEPANPAADLADMVTCLLRKRCLEFLGLAKGAGIATLGETQTESALRAGKVALLLHAPDAARTLDNRHEVMQCSFFSRDELGAAFGYDHIVYAGVSAHKLTEKLKLEINRLSSMLSSAMGPIVLGRKENEG